MSHYTSNTQGFLVGLGLKRSVTTLCGLTLDQVEDLGSPSSGEHATCSKCRKCNGEK
jgi:hypothetical protein